MKKIKDFFYNFLDIIFVVIVIVGIIFVLYTTIKNISNISQETENKTITETIAETKKEIKISVDISSGFTLEQVAEILREYDVISDKDAFLKSIDNKNVKIKYGKHELSKNMDFNKIKEIIFKK